MGKQIKVQTHRKTFVEYYSCHVAMYSATKMHLNIYENDLGKELNHFKDAFLIVKFFYKYHFFK